MQRVEIIGYIGNDATIKDLGQNQVINFNVAVSESYTKQGTNEKITTTTWYEVAKWGNNTSLAQYLKKGTQVWVSGKPANRAYQKEDGSTVIVNGIGFPEIKLLGSKTDNTNSAAPAAQSFAPATNFNEEEHDDLPF